jgi:hypothetical protein
MQKASSWPLRGGDEVTSVDPELDDLDQTAGWPRLMLDVPLTQIDRNTGRPREQWVKHAKDGLPTDRF